MDNIFITMKIGDCLYGWHPHICGNKRRTDTDHKSGTGKIMRKQLVLKSQEMQVLQDKDWVSRHDYWRRKNLNRPCQTWRNKRLANPNHSETNTIFLRIWKLYRKFISHYSDLAQPLNDLMKKDKKFEWTTKCQEVFDILKQWFTEEPVLLMLRTLFLLWHMLAMPFSSLFHLRSNRHLPQGKHTFHICLPRFYPMFYMCLPQGWHLPLTYLNK